MAHDYHQSEMGGRSSHFMVVDEKQKNDQISSLIQRNLEMSVFGDQTALPEKEEGFHIVNVTSEVMKNENVREIMREHGVCTCQRCQSDVLALTLTTLGPKYCVMYEHTESPIIRSYSIQYRDKIRAAIDEACDTVKAHPRH